MNNAIGVLQGRLTSQEGRGIQFFPYDNWKQEFIEAKKIGLNCIEFLIQRKDWGNPAHPLLSPAGIENIRSVVEQTGVIVPSVHAYYEPRDTFPEELITIAQASEAIGAETVLLSFFKQAALTSPEAKEKARQYIVDTLSRVGETKMRFGFEAELPAEELLAFIGTLPMPERFGVYYDLGNQYACGFPVAHELQTLGTKVFGVHIKDRLTQIPDAPESASVPLGEGSANLPEALATLHEIGYTNPLVIQGARKEGTDDVQLVSSYAAYVRKWLK